MKRKNIMEMKGISISFPGVKALDDVDFTLEEGTIHAICGENGAGKSTLMKILYGIYSMNKGEIWIKGIKREIISPLVAQELGLSIIFQELNLIDKLSIAENIFLGRLETSRYQKINWLKINNEAKKLLNRIGVDFNPKTELGKLSVSQKQIVEIAKALSYNADIIVMDEPSATLTANELKDLYTLIFDLKKKGISIVYISHKMDEIFKVSDQITVLRDGKIISTKNASDTSREEVIRDMVGRSIEQEFPIRDRCFKDRTILEVKNVTRKGALDNINFKLREGEVLGLSGLVGAGRTELVRAVFGADKIRSGSFLINGSEKKIKSPRDAIANKIALVTEDRKMEGIILDFSIKKNISITDLKNISRLGFLSKKKERQIAEKYIDKLSVKTSSCEQRCLNLSGGNQQKVVLAKWFYSNADILILDEPTRGIDVGAKYEIYLIINELVQMGKSVILISSEMPEILSLSDRIIVMHEGKITGEISNEQNQATAEEVMHYAIL